MLKVKVLNYTPNGEELIASAAKLCYSNVGVEEIQKKQTPKDIEKFINMLINLGHDSPLEHVSFTFAIEGVSRTLTHQLVRHRLSSYSQQSQRYVTLDNFEYIIPPQIENNIVAKEIFIHAMEEDAKAYDTITKVLMYEKIQNNPNYELLNCNKDNVDECIELFKVTYPVDYNQMKKSVIEDARYVFPNACETKIIATMNIRTLLNFLSLRTCNRAQWEIRELAIQMLNEVKQIYPTLFRKAGPGCIRGKCPEGVMTCGKIEEVRERFKM